ncbi:MAG TPA: FliM/FliN family flagellar motor switch protein [Bryobacteraceae bacterium]|nr:FliM/FliN family flagellar motor switch protein [Bryobacteraceae bacterium]
MSQEQPQKIHAISQGGLATADGAPDAKIMAFDFRKPGQTPGSHMRAIDALKQKFLYRVTSSLSAYLRSSVTAQLLAIDHLSYGEFLRGLPTPTCVVSVGMQPYEGNAVLELNPSLIFPIIEILLGGNGKPGTAANREITEIEQNVLDGLFRIILQALAEAWKDVVPVTLTLESVGKEARLIHAPHEPMVTMSFEIKLEEGGGQMNLAVPTEILAMQGEDDAQSAPRKVEASEADQARILGLLREAKFTLEANLAGPMLRVRDLLELKEGNVLTFDHPIEQPLDGLLNGKRKFAGQIVSTGKKKAFQIE